MTSRYYKYSTIKAYALSFKPLVIDDNEDERLAISGNERSDAADVTAIRAHSCYWQNYRKVPFENCRQSG